MKTQKKNRLSRRITWRVIGIILGINILIMASVLYVLMTVSEAQSELRTTYLVDDISNKLQSMLSIVDAAAVNNVAEIEQNLDNPEHVYQALERELHDNKYYRGCFVAFKPNYYPSKGRWFEPYVSYKDSTIVRQQIGGADHNYFKYDWYTKGINIKEGESGYLSDLYYDDDGAKTYVSTYVLPIHDSKGHIVGVYGIDFVMDWLVQSIEQEVREIKEREMVENDPENPNDTVDFFFCMIVDGKGQQIAGSHHIDDDKLKEILQADSASFQYIDINNSLHYVGSRQLEPTNWTLIVAQHWFMIYLQGIGLSIIVLFLMIVGIFLIFFTIKHSIRRATKPLSYLTESAEEVAKGNFNTPLPTFKQNDEITQLRDSFSTMQESLKQYIEEVKKGTAAKATYESELNIAHSIQMSMLPKMNPPFPDRTDIQLYGLLKPAKAVGGDLFDFFIHDEKLFFCIGDVSGKGVPGSLVMAVTRTLFRNIATHIHKANHIVKSMNENLCENNEQFMFVTLFVGVLDIQSGHLEYCNAGHNSPYIGHDMMPCDPNLPLGIEVSWNFSLQQTTLPHGTTIFMYTDGLTEAENANHQLFDDSRVADVINALEGDAAAPEALISTMAAAVTRFVGDTEQSDDLTMLAIRVVEQ